MIDQEGLFITFEGPDGSGKSTQIKNISLMLSALRVSVLTTREPGGTEIGEQVRNVLHDLSNQDMLPKTEVLLFSSARHQLTGKRIRPHLAKGGIVLSDRYFDSTFAYQGYGHGQNLNDLRMITNFATGGLVPDLTILFDLEPNDGVERRMKDKGLEWTRLDAMALEFHERVRRGFLQMASEEPDRWTIINAGKSKPEVTADVWYIVESFLKQRGVAMLRVG